jgi:hypothetical protein
VAPHANPKTGQYIDLVDDFGDARLAGGLVPEMLA